MSGTATASMTQRAVGVAVHSTLAELAGSDVAVDVSSLLVVSGRHSRNVAASTGARVGAQHVAPLAAAGVRMFPPRGEWAFAGAEQPAGPARRVDLIWRNPLGEILIDEVKIAGFGRVLEDGDTRAQIAAYQQWGLSRFGDRFIGVRLLALAGPLRSRFHPPGGLGRPLAETGWWWWHERLGGHAG